MRFGCEAYFYLHSENLFSYFLGKRPSYFRALFPGSSPAIRCNQKASSPMSTYEGHQYDAQAHYELRCRECGRSWGNQPRSICDECFSPLEITYDYDAIPASMVRGKTGQGKF